MNSKNAAGNIAYLMQQLCTWHRSCDLSPHEYEQEVIRLGENIAEIADKWGMGHCVALYNHYQDKAHAPEHTQ